MTLRAQDKSTLRRWAASVAGFAFGYIWVTQIYDRFFYALVIPLILLLLAFWGLILHYVYSAALGLACPYCGGLTLERRAITPFGARFYQCSKCGVRCMRVAFGWKDASDARYDPLYARKQADDPWSGAPGLEDEDLIASETHNHLLQNKRNRQPGNPNGPGLE